jgi:hypothetical protein
LKYDILLNFLENEFGKAVLDSQENLVEDMRDYLHAVLSIINFGSSFRSRNLTLPRGYDVTAPNAEDTMRRVLDEMTEDWSKSDISNFGTKWEPDGMFQLTLHIPPLFKGHPSQTFLIFRIGAQSIVEVGNVEFCIYSTTLDHFMAYSCRKACPYSFVSVTYLVVSLLSILKYLL